MELTMFKRVLVLTILGIGMSAASAQAQPAVQHHPRSINARQHHQAARIRDGIRDGSLTRAEATRLRAEAAALRAEERRYRRTGPGLTRWEARDLQRDLNRTNRDIRRTRHNARKR
jgi:predicted carbohydrate-binding protein with CBM5 and CBM33 domain